MLVCIKSKKIVPYHLAFLPGPVLPTRADEAPGWSTCLTLRFSSQVSLDVGRCIVAETKSRGATKRVKRRQGQKLHFSDRDERSIFGSFFLFRLRTKRK